MTMHMCWVAPESINQELTLARESKLFFEDVMPGDVGMPQQLFDQPKRVKQVQ